MAEYVLNNDDFKSFAGISEETKWGDPGYEESSEEFIKRIEDEGFKVVYPKSNELFIDIDSEKQLETFNSHFNRLHNEFNDMKRIYYPSKSGFPRTHIIVTMPFNMSNLERIAWQAVLGSDPVRELLSMIRLTNGLEHPTLFCEPKEKNNG